MGAPPKTSVVTGINRLGRLLDHRPMVLPEVRLQSVGCGALRVKSDCSVQLFAQDVSVTCVPIGLADHMDEDIEQHHIWAWPPGHMALSVNVKNGDRGIRVFPRFSVPVNDLSARFVRRGPHCVEVTARIVPSGPAPREGTAEDVTEVPGLGNREVLDKAEEIGPRSG
jgi:hypothetical protein